MLLKNIDRTRIVIINLPTEHLKSDTEIMARGPLSIHSFLRKKGIDSILVDLAGTREENWPMIPDADLYGISTVTCQVFYAERLASFLKSRHPRAVVLMGGAHAVALPGDCLKNRHADVVCIGEGELAVFELMDSGRQLSDIKGFAYLDDSGNVVGTGKRPLAKDIEQFYPLRFQDYGIYRYLHPKTYKFFNRDADDLQLNVMISRGCYGSCKFCMSGQTGAKSIRHRNITTAVDELIQYKKRWGINRVYFDDDEMLSKKGMFEALCDEMPRSDLDWLCLGRSDRVTPEKLARLVDAGCTGIVYGIEHFSDRVLCGLNKGNTGKQNYKALIQSAKYNLKVRAQMMTGCVPYETWDDVKLTAAYVKRVIAETEGRVRFSFHIYQPLPGTASYEEALGCPEHFDPRRLTDFSEFQTVGNFQRHAAGGIDKRPRIAHRKAAEVFDWYDYLVETAGEAEIAANHD
ncbi:MAG: radical SAM protein [Pseudomonadota bacterium]